MTLANTYPTQGTAEAALMSEGFELSPNSVDRDVWRKMSKVDDWYGGYAAWSLVVIEERHVHADYGGGSYFEPRFL